MPTETVPLPPQVVERASEWFVLMRESAVSAGEREQFVGWLLASPQHAGAYIEIAKLWGDASQVNPLLDVSIDPRTSSNITRFPGYLTAEDAPPPAREFSRPLRMVAGLLFATAICLGLWLKLTSGVTYSDGPAEQRSITLEDGSVVRLDSSSKLIVRFSKRRRTLELIEGQALFQVTHDPERPFIVTSGGASVRAVGTEFNVNGLSERTVVTVVEGKVRLSGPARLQNASVSKGQQASIDRHGQVEMQADADVAASTGWLQHRLIYQGSRLGEVVEEFNRHNRVPIVLADRRLTDMRINAIFRTTDSASLLQFLGGLEGVRVERRSNEIRVDRGT
jgi:transmembrane sensor